MKLLIALGGNALMDRGSDRTFESQFSVARKAMTGLYSIIQDHHVVLTHGNGPQVGDILSRNELPLDGVPGMPLHACGSMSQGLIAEIILNAYYSIQKNGKPMTAVFTRTVVSEDDPAFSRPTKPVGKYYSEEDVDVLSGKKGLVIRQMPNGKWRRVVPSPEPIKIMEAETIEILLNSEIVPLCVGGGGTPVSIRNGNFAGVDAVIDKDLASSFLAASLRCDMMIILTDVENVFLNYGKPEQKALTHTTAAEMESMLASGQFSAGSMGPKVQAAINFLKKGGKRAVIASLNNAREAVEGKSGTTITAA
ncbi:MAG: carbamate kinase [Candidatus Thermoplasmatota archaeon]|nr:carbamate kinase [Candidatus Thermoplasmatota archaeon]MCL5731525.1 carbamate kinase [Candidatus Thermoplasmatota archaeon]